MRKFYDVHLKMQIGEIEKTTVKRVEAIDQFDALLEAVKIEDGSDDVSSIANKVAELAEEGKYRRWILGADEMVGYFAEFIVELEEFEINYKVGEESISKIALLPKSAKSEYSDQYYFKQ